MSNAPHLFSDGAVYAVGTDKDVSRILRPVSRVDGDIVFSVFHTVDAFSRQDSFLMLQTVQQDLENCLSIDENLGIANPTIA